MPGQTNLSIVTKYITCWRVIREFMKNCFLCVAWLTTVNSTCMVYEHLYSILVLFAIPWLLLSNRLWDTAITCITMIQSKTWIKYSPSLKLDWTWQKWRETSQVIVNCAWLSHIVCSNHIENERFLICGIYVAVQMYACVDNLTWVFA